MDKTKKIAQGMHVPSEDKWDDDAEYAREVLDKLNYIEKLRPLPYKASIKDLHRTAAGLPFAYLADLVRPLTQYPALATPPAPGPRAAAGAGEAVGAWVSVSERLPEFAGSYLCHRDFISESGSRTKYSTSGHYNPKAGGFSHNSEVTYWCEYPADPPTTGAAAAAPAAGDVS